MTRHVIVHQFDPTRHVVGGIDGYIRDVIEHAGAEHAFAIIGVEQNPAARLGRWRAVEVNGRRVEFMPVARFEAGNQRRRIPHSLRLAYGLVRYRPDVRGAIVHNHRAELGAVTSVVFPHARRIQFIHDDALEAFRWREETMWRFAPRVYELLERRAVRSADKALVMSRSAVARLRGQSLPVSLQTNWYDGKTFHANGRRTGRGHVPRIGWAGRLEPPKDPLTAVAVFAELRSRGVAFEAWFAGDGTLAGPTRRAIREAGLEEAVRMAGVLSPTELAGELRTCDLFLMTSLWEGIPRAAIEALACGVPVAATAVGELPVLLADGANGVIAQSRSAADLADAVVAALAIEPGSRVAGSVDALEVRQIVPRMLDELVEAAHA